MSQIESLENTNLNQKHEQDAFRALGVAADTDFGLQRPADLLLQQQLHAEIYDLPDIQVEDLLESERQKLHFTMVPTTHTTRYAAPVAQALRYADYVLLETVGLTEQQRLGLDLVDNLMVRGVPVQVSHPNLVLLEEANLNNPRGDWRGDIYRNLVRTAPRMPVVRIIDVANDSPTFKAAEAATSPDTILVACLPEELYGTSHKKMYDHAKKQLAVVGKAIFTRDEEQFRDISNVAAKAVRMHPEKDHIEIGVSFGAAHSMVARRLQHHQLPMTEHWIGPNADAPHDVLRAGSSRYSFTLGDAMLRKAAYCPEEITDENVHCLIAYRLIGNALRTPLSGVGGLIENEGISYALETVASAAVYKLTSAQHMELLHLASEDRAHLAIPIMRGVRLGTAKMRTDRAILEYLNNTLGSLELFTNKVITELTQATTTRVVK